MNAHEQAAELAARWRLDKRVRSYAGDCPACSYPRAFAIRVKDTRLKLFCANGCAWDALNDAARRTLGNTWMPQPAPDVAEVEAARGRKQAAALRLFSGSTAVAALDPAGRYLAGRGLPHLVGRPALRFRGDCPHPEGGWLPAMVAEVLDVAGRPVAAHRTYLTPAGGKAGDPAKASLGPVWGGAVRLDPAAPELVIGEGIETAASGGLLLGLPAWAAISAGNLERGLLLPPEVRAVVIAADPDPKGREAAAAAKARWLGEGRRVRIATPDQPGRDFNDLVQERARRAAEAAHG